MLLTEAPMSASTEAGRRGGSAAHDLMTTVTARAPNLNQNYHHMADTQVKLSSRSLWSAAILEEKPAFLNHEVIRDVEDFPETSIGIRHYEGLLVRFPERHPYLLVRLAAGYLGIACRGVAVLLFEEALYYLDKKKIPDTKLQQTITAQSALLEDEAQAYLNINWSGSLQFFQPWRSTYAAYPYRMAYPVGHEDVRDNWQTLFGKGTELFDAYLRALSIHTNQLEGIFLVTSESTQDLVRRGIADGVIDSIPKPSHARGYVEDHQTIRNIINDTLAAYDFISSHGGPINMDILCTIHRKIMNTAGYLSLPIVPGGYTRTVTKKSVFISTNRGPIQCCSHYAVNQELEKILKRASAILVANSDSDSSSSKDFENPFGFASWLHFTLARCHPFNDGNGRTARMLASLPLIRAGYPPIAINLSQRADYLDAINTGYNKDFRPLADCMCRGMMKTIEHVKEAYRSQA